ncbi:MAG TPA: orotate phosphoribosyltransferase [Bacillota bacterium]|jgi:orotate phosphoribosyltransferase|nr:orotate phosphoribosyltransferase [Bacillota bacterium]
MDNKRKFIKFLMDSGVLIFGDFITKSGRSSPYFINMGNIRTGAQLSALGEFYGECITVNISKGLIPSDFNVLFGPAYKGIPLSVATAIALARDYGKDISYCFNRKEEKDHGEGGSIVGHKLREGDKVLIIEDVITAGTAVRESIPLLKKAADVQICGLIIAVDRMEKGQGDSSAVRELLEDYGIPTFSIVNIRETLETLLNGGPGFEEDTMPDITSRMKEYMKKYCVS